MITPQVLDPSNGQNNEDGQIIQSVDPPLIFFNLTSAGTNVNYSKPIGVLAKSWTVSADEKTWTFYLRQGVYYSNGDQFNAYAVWYDLYRALETDVGGAASVFIGPFLNDTGVSVADLNSLNNSQNTPSASLLAVMQNPHNSITVVNSTEVQFHLDGSYLAFLPTIGTNPWVYQDPHDVEMHGGVVANQSNTYETVNGTMVGNGPYVMQSYTPNEQLVLVANPHYWAQNITNNFVLRPAHIQKIIINYKPDELTRELDLEKGDAQAAMINFPSISNVLKTDSNAYIPNLGLSGTVEFIFLDNLKFPTNNTLVRQAIIAAINTTEIDQVAYGGYAVPYVGPLPKGYPGYNASITAAPYNLTLAKQLLVKAGYPNGQGIPTINFLYPANGYLAQVAQLVTSDLAQIGITVQPQQVSYNTWGINLVSNPGNSSAAPIMSYAGLSDYPDFTGYEFFYESCFGYLGVPHNATICQEIKQSNNELNAQQRLLEISQISSQLQRNADFIWLGQPIDFFDTGVGYGPTIFNKCLTGMWLAGSFNGDDFNAIEYTCSPSS